MNTRVKKLPLLVASLISAGALSAQAACPLDETIQIADMSWASASAIAHIESKILQLGYDCKTELVPLETVTAATTMVNKGRPHIAPEVWSSNIATLLEEGEKKGTISIAGKVFASGGLDAWWVPKYVVEQYPDIKSVQDMARYAHLFKSQGSDKGRFYNSLPGWSNETRSTNLFRGYGLDQHYDIYSAGSGAALDSAISSNYKRKKPVFFYYWAPSAILGKYDMVQLSMNDYDAANDACNAEANCPTPSAGGYPVVDVNTLVSSKLKDGAPELYQFLTKVSFENDTVNKLLAWGEDNKADPAEVAEHFLKNHQAIWTTWVPKNVSDKVLAGLQ
ncbi:ABC transporter substrate-binding protein [Pseudomonas benzenivorans]|uniref:ABC transporter substrate-binding protein n=1 Tax=Pseudomonas benzenivorans TaxID=556533 RepID=A0ABY5H4I1_9PSED|nr:ABC transporter substrate-binding protein [Pseudomonas benzenivorans]UTW06984.1 ABC transporter substrate-binding protein [Pseudomonas benzenivorans]